MSNPNFKSTGVTSREIPSFNPSLDRLPINTHTTFFENAKVQSSVGKTAVGNTYYAVPYPTASRLPARDQPTEFVSEYMDKFKNGRYEYSSMAHKPLQKYNSLAYRNRNAIPDPPVPFWNQSTVNLGRNAGYCPKRHFVTSNQVAYTGVRLDPRTNGGTVARESKWRREQRDK